MVNISKEQENFIKSELSNIVRKYQKEISKDSIELPEIHSLTDDELSVYLLGVISGERFELSDKDYNEFRTAILKECVKRNLITNEAAI